jgi:hypothetical protein
MAFNTSTMRDFVKLDLGPALHAAGLNNLRVMIVDDDRLLVSQWADAVSIRAHTGE